MGLGGILGGISDLFGGNSIDQYQGIQPPNPQSMELALQQYVDQGLLTPQDAEAIKQDPSAFNQITSDPKFKQAQMSALSGLQNVANQGGLTAIDKGQLNDIANQENTQARGAREAIQQNAAERGVGGSGLDFLAQLKNQQAATSDQSNRDTSVAANAQQRALQALIGSGNMAGQMQGQDFSQQAQKASAADAINRFNAQNQQNVNLYNTGSQNQAQMYNLGQRQNIANMNTGIGNQQQMYNKGLPQQNFQNQMQLAGAKSGAFNNDRGYKQQDWNSIGDTLGNFLKVPGSPS